MTAMIKVALTLSLATVSAGSAVWQTYKDKDCLLGIGASGVDGQSGVHTGATAKECQEICVKAAGCEAVITGKRGDGSFMCHLRQNVKPEKCISGRGEADLYVLLSTYTDTPDKDCLVGIGSTFVPGVPEPFSTSMTLEDCETACGKTVGCEAVITRKDAGGTGCYLRQKVDPAQCFASAGHADLYLLKDFRKDGKLIHYVAMQQKWQLPEELATGIRVSSVPFLAVGAAMVLFGTAGAAAWRVRSHRAVATEESLELGLEPLAEE